MPEPTPALVRAVGEAIEDACLQWIGRDVGTVHRDDIARAAIAAMPPANPPGSSVEQLPADVLALLPIRPYLSTACETAEACETGAAVHSGERPWLLAHAEDLHQRCRLSHKFTGQPCACRCHGHQPAPRDR